MDATGFRRTIAICLGLVGCGTNGGTLSEPEVERSSYAAEGATCTGTDAHDAHEFSIGCTLCHACGGTYGLQELEFPRGTSTIGGEITLGTPTTCTVQCHNLSGATPDSVAWDSPGPLACTSCHDQIVDTGGNPIVSSHPVDTSTPEDNRAACQNCHVLDDHLGGAVLITLGDGSVVDATNAEVNQVCESCHAESGRSLAGLPPPLIPDFSDPNGDFHGARVGTGWGGTLAAPYVRGEGPLPCTACHDSHASANAYLFRGAINGEDVPAGTISTTGVGAEAVCERCHLGNRHAGCETSSCHTAGDPAGPGQPCFWCHRHEGIVNFVYPKWNNPHHIGSNCAHCHGGGIPSSDTTPPTIGNLRVFDILADQATVEWTTNDEKSTSFVDYGIGSPSMRAGNSTLTMTHSVRLTGLSELSTYSFRVRSSDNWGNEAVSALGTFSTPGIGAPTAPTLVAEGMYENTVGCPPSCGATIPVTLNWNTVTLQSGNSVEYRAQVSTSPTFATVNYDSGWVSGTSYAFSAPARWWPDGFTFYWRAMSRDASTLATSPWSPSDSFYVHIYDPYY